MKSPEEWAREIVPIRDDDCPNCEPRWLQREKIAAALREARKEERSRAAVLAALWLSGVSDDVSIPDEEWQALLDDLLDECDMPPARDPGTAGKP